MAKHDVNVVIKARDQASRKFKKVGGAAGSMAGAFKKAAAAAGAYFGARALLNFAKGALEAFSRQEVAVKKLQTALGNLGAGDQIASMEAFAASMQRITVFGDEALMEIMALGAGIGKLSGDQLKGATKAAIGLSEAFGMDVVAAMRLVARAAVGDTASLTRYGIKLDQTLSAQEKFNAVLKIGADNFNLATAAANTYGGSLEQMKNDLGDLKESAGELFAKVGGPKAVSWWARMSQEGMKTLPGLFKAWKKFMTFQWGDMFNKEILNEIAWGGKSKKPTPPGRKQPEPPAADDPFKLSKKQVAERIAAVQKLKDRAKSIWEETRTPLENFKLKWAEIFDLWQKGFIDFGTYLRALQQIKEKFPIDRQSVTINGKEIPILKGTTGTLFKKYLAGADIYSKFGKSDKIKTQLAAQESRFLTMAPGSRRRPEVQTAENTKTANKTLAKIETNTRQQVAETGPTILAANF